MNPGLAIGGVRRSLSRQNAAVAALFLLGLLLRLRQYFTGRSLWVDEAMLALNIVNRGFAGMFQPLDYDQGAPIGFLLVEKAFHSLLGKNEFALRLFPLLAGSISLWLFYLLLRRLAGPAGVLVALTLFVLNPRLVYYSSEVKQYSLDVAVTIGLLLIAGPALSASARKQDFAWLTLAGLVALWFSHPALFVLAGIGLALVSLSLQRGDLPRLWLAIGMGCLWMLEIGGLYLLILKELSRNAYMRAYWQGAFLPMPPWSDPGWFTGALGQNIRLQLGMPYAAFFVFLLLLGGWVALFRRSPGYGMAFAGSLLATAIASALQLYPVFERMVLFLVPLGLVLLGKAVEAFYRQVQNYRLAGVASTFILAAFLIYGPLTASLQAFMQPKYFEHIRPALEHLRDSWKDGDGLFVSNGALPAFRYYAPFYGLENIPYRFGRREDYRNPANILSQLDSFRGQPRVWVLLSHVYERGDFNERDFILEHLDRTGKKRREFRVPGTSVYLYLYDLRNEAAIAAPVPSASRPSASEPFIARVSR